MRCFTLNAGRDASEELLEYAELPAFAELYNDKSADFVLLISGAMMFAGVSEFWVLARIPCT